MFKLNEEVIITNGQYNGWHAIINSKHNGLKAIFDKKKRKWYNIVTKNGDYATLPSSSLKKL